MQQRPPVDPALQRLRDRLDSVNRRLLALLQERAEVVLEVAALKDELGLDSYDPRREAEMLRELTADPQGAFDSAELAEIFRAIFAVSLELQRRLRQAAHEAAAERERVERERQQRPHPKIQAVGR